MGRKRISLGRALDNGSIFGKKVNTYIIYEICLDFGVSNSPWERRHIYDALDFLAAQAPTALEYVIQECYIPPIYQRVDDTFQKRL